MWGGKTELASGLFEGAGMILPKDLLADLEAGDRTVEHLLEAGDRTVEHLEVKETSMFQELSAAMYLQQLAGINQQLSGQGGMQQSGFGQMANRSAQLGGGLRW